MPRRDGSGRQEIAIDWKSVNSLLEAGSTGTEVAAYIGIHPDTLYNRVVKTFKMSFADYSAKMRSKGDSQLRAKQYAEAMKGDKTMLVWLGKQRLGQKEKGEFDHNHKVSWVDALQKITVKEPLQLNDEQQ